MPKAGDPDRTRRVSQSSCVGKGSSGSGESVRDGGGVLLRHQQQAAGGLSQRAADGDGIYAADVHRWGRVLLAGQIVGFGFVEAEGGGGPGAGKGDDGEGAGNVLHLEVFHDGVLVEPLYDRLLLAGAGEQVDELPGLNDAQQVDDAASVAGQHGWSPVAGLEVIDLVGGQAVYQVEGVIAGRLQTAVIGAVDGKAFDGISRKLVSGLLQGHGSLRVNGCLG